MLELKDLEPLLAPISTCPSCQSTDVVLRSIGAHLHLSLVCRSCGEPRVVVILFGANADVPKESERPSTPD